MLRELGLCNKLSAGLHHVAPGFGFFTISVDLTEEALGCVDSIISLVFQVSDCLARQVFQSEAPLITLSQFFHQLFSISVYKVIEDGRHSKMDFRRNFKIGRNVVSVQG